MAVEGYVGRHGQGKTYTAVWDCLHAFVEQTRKAEKRGRPGPELWSNAAIVGGERFSTWDELMDLVDGAAQGHKRAIVLIDEAGKFLPSRFWNKLDPRVMTLLEERRKVGAGLDLYWTAPTLGRVDNLLRTVTQTVWITRRFGGSEYAHDDDGRPPLLFRSSGYDPDLIDTTTGRARSKAKPLAKRTVPFVAEVAQLYTTGIVDMSKPLDAKVGRRPDYYGAGDRDAPDTPAVELDVGIQLGKGKRAAVAAVGEGRRAR